MSPRSLIIGARPGLSGWQFRSAHHLDNAAGIAAAEQQRRQPPPPHRLDHPSGVDDVEQEKPQARERAEPDCPTRLDAALLTTKLSARKSHQLARRALQHSAVPPCSTPPRARSHPSLRPQIRLSAPVDARVATPRSNESVFPLSLVLYPAQIRYVAEAGR